jgi:uncharacterized protein (TIGR00725 family)
VVGPGEVDPADAHHLRHAEAVGAGIARRGAALVCGGLGGVMEAAARGAAGAGGLTVGLLPGVDRAAANPYVRLPVATGLGELRNGLVVRTSDVLIAVGGAYGTLSEVALALRLGVVVVGLGTWGLLRPDGAPDTGVLVAGDPDDALRCAFEAIGRLPGGSPGPEAGGGGPNIPVP